MPRRLKLDSHPHPFEWVEAYCDNPDCDCNAVGLKLSEILPNEQSQADPLTTQLWVSLETWEECDPPERDPAVASIIASFLRDLPEDEKQRIREEYRQEKERVRHRAAYQMPILDILEGLYVSYCDLNEPRGALSKGGECCTYRLEAFGRTFLIEDSYCPNPDCDCRQLDLLVMEAIGDGSGGYRKLLPRFNATVYFDRRPPSVDRLIDCDRSTAKRILSAWWEEYADDLPMWRERYEDVKTFGQRMLEQAEVEASESRPAPRGATRLSQPLVADAVTADSATIGVPREAHQQATSLRVGRNAPCPCGSGKKYKKCCGRPSRAAPR